MSEPSPICIQWKTGRETLWNTLRVSGVPVGRKTRIRLDFGESGLEADGELLIEEIKALLIKVGGSYSPDTVEDLIEAQKGESRLEVMFFADGQPKAALPHRCETALAARAREHAWVLPVLRGTDTHVLPDKLRAQNIAFWPAGPTGMKSLALTILGRAGVTSLDRRVFISYRRVDTEPLAKQLRDALSKRNYSVFLDTVSVEPGVDFQDRLFEDLADKSMIVLLHSETCHKSRWTMEEIEFARRNQLSVLILRMPDVPNGDPLEVHYRSGGVRYLAEKDFNDPGSPVSGFIKDTLDSVVTGITEVHDGEMITRLAIMKTRIQDALRRHSLTQAVKPCEESSSLILEYKGQKFRLFPTARPPGVPELFDAKEFDVSGPYQRVVIGHVDSFHPVRRLHLDWVVTERNVTYLDISNLDAWIQAFVLNPLPAAV